MQPIVNMIIKSLELGMIYSLLTMSTYLTSRIIKFDDLTIDGSFGLGGAITIWLLSHHVDPITSLGISLCAGAAAGLATALLYTYMGFNNLISGIIVSAALFSVNVRTAGYVQSISKSAESLWQFIPFDLGALTLTIALSLCAITLFTLLYWFLSTEVGLLIYATGDNPRRLILLGENPKWYRAICLMIANALNALGGSLLVHYNGFFSIWSTVGILITCLAGIIIASIFNARFNPALIVGATIYQAILLISQTIQPSRDLNKLIAAILIIIIMLFKRQRNGLRTRR